MKQSYIIGFLLIFSALYLPLVSIGETNHANTEYSLSTIDNATPKTHSVTADNLIKSQTLPRSYTPYQQAGLPLDSKMESEISLGVNSLPPRLPTIKAMADDTAPYDVPYQISDILQGQGGDPWNGETVTLHRNGSGVLDSKVTAIDGSFTFDLAFTPADIGLWNYTVEFAGNLPFRKAGTPTVFLLQVIDPVTITVTVDKTNVGGSELYTYTFTAVTTSGNPAPTPFSVNYQEQYTITNGEEVSGTVILTGGVGSYGSTYGDTSGWPGGTNTADISLTGLSVVNEASFPNYSFTFDTPTPIVTVTVAYGFAIDVLMDASTYNSVPKYYRNDQVFDIHLNVSSYGGDTLPEIQANVGNKAYTVVISGAGNSFGTSLNGNLDLNGQADISFTLSVANFQNMNLNVNTQIVVIITVDGSINNLDDYDQQFIVKLREDLASLSAGHTIDVNAFYYPGTSSNIIVSGTLLDQWGDPAAGVQVILRIRNGVYNPLNGSLETITFAPNAITSAAGAYIFTISNFNFGLTSNQLIYLNVTIGDVSGNQWVNANPAGLTQEVGSFKYFKSLISTFTYNFNGGNEPSEQTLTASLQAYLNNTLYDIITNGSYVEITIRDEFNRIPDGIQVRFNGPNSQVLTFMTLTGTNNGEFNVTYASMFANVPVGSYNIWGQTFSITLTSGTNAAGPLQSTISKTYRIFGPDNVAPTLISAPSLAGNNTGFDDDIVVTVLIAGGTNARLNIRNVTLYYRFSDALVDSNPVFSSGYSLLAMNYNSGSGIASYTFPFSGHGNWSQFFVIVYDLAGWGLLDNGSVPGSPLYANDLYSLSVTTSTFRAKMGDTIIDLTWSNNLPQYVYINGTAMSSGLSTNLTLNQNLRIDIYIPADNGNKGYGSVTIYWKIITYNKYGTIDNNPLIYFMNFMIEQAGNPVITPIAGTYRYQFIIEGGNFTAYFQTVEFYFEISDIYGNTNSTSEISNFINNSTVFGSIVQDEVLPSNPTPIVTTSKSHPPISATQSEVWNLNETAYIIFTITDSETGIYTITIYIIYKIQGVDTIVSKVIVLNGISQIINPAFILAPIAAYNSSFGNFGTAVNVTSNGADYTVGLLIDFNGIFENTTISYMAETRDFSGNLRTTNAQNGQQISFFIKNAFVEEFSNTDVTVITSETVITIVTTDSNGNTITIVSTSTGISTVFNLGKEAGSNNAALVILLFTTLVVGITLWYQRHNIMETFARRARARKVRGTLSELTDEIKRLGAEGQYRKAILLTWEALERVSREIVQAPRAYNQTAREYASFLSTVTIVDRETLLTLSNSFESAKYGRDEPSIDVWDDAIKALEITVLTIIESGARVQLDEDDEEFN